MFDMFADDAVELFAYDNVKSISVLSLWLVGSIRRTCEARCWVIVHCTTRFTRLLCTTIMTTRPACKQQGGWVKK